jgi:hypothetical protein
MPPLLRRKYQLRPFIWAAHQFLESGGKPPHHEKTYRHATTQEGDGVLECVAKRANATRDVIHELCN